MSDKFTWMHSGQIGAPQMNGAAGSNGQMLQVLDGCLINGFNPQTVTIATKTATTVTLTFGVSHGYELSQIIAVSGATDAALNGQHRVTAKTATTITIDAAGVAVTTGTITTKISPLGWESIFGSTDPLRRAYRSFDNQSSQSVLYLDMNLPTGHGYNATNPVKRAMVSVCEDMTTIGVQINSYTNAENNYTTNANGKLLWYQARDQSKSNAVTQTQNKKWVLVGDGKVFYFFNEWRVYSLNEIPLRDFFAFGDADSLDGSVGVNNCFWIGVINENDTSTVRYAHVGAVIGGGFVGANAHKGYMMKGYNGTGVIVPILMSVDGTLNIFNSGSYGFVENFPNPSTQKTVGFSTHLVTAIELRATLPNLLSIPQNLNQNYSLLDMSVSDGALLVGLSVTGSTPVMGFFGIDLRS